MTSQPLYPFGFGLSYTTFAYSELSVLPKTVRYTDDVKIDVYLMNTGKVDGDEVRTQILLINSVRYHDCKVLLRQVVQVYAQSMNSTLPGTPNMQLVGFKRVTVAAGRAVNVEFRVQLEQLAVWDDHRAGFVTQKGKTLENEFHVSNPQCIVHVFLSGLYTFYVGGQQPNMPRDINVGSNVLKAGVIVL